MFTVKLRCKGLAGISTTACIDSARAYQPCFAVDITLALAKPILAMPDQNILLLIYFVAFLLLAFVIRSVLVYRNTGINPLVLPRTQDAYGYVGMAFKVLMLGCTGVVTLLAFVPNASTWHGAITPLEITSIKGFGVAPIHRTL